MTDDPHDALLLDRQICFPLYAASNLLTRLYRPLLAELDLTYPQYLVMLVLWESAPIPMGELCARLHLDSGTLSPLLKRLEKVGYVTRHRDERDERRMIVGLTDEGDALRGPAADVPKTLGSRFGVSPEELDSLRAAARRTLELVATHLGDE